MILSRWSASVSEHSSSNRTTLYLHEPDALSTGFHSDPDYVGFTEQAFTADRGLWPNTKSSVELLQDKHVHLIHSRNDGLITLRQPCLFKSWLDQSDTQPASVVEDFDKVTEQHDEMLDATSLSNTMIDYLMHLEPRVLSP